MGKKLAAYDAQKTIVAFYDTIDSPAPDGVSVIQITDAEWEELLAGQAAGQRLVIDASGKPALLPPAPPTPEQIVARNTASRDRLLERVSVALMPLQMAVSLGEATDDEREAARQWVLYSRSVKSVSLTVADPVWPAEPEIAGSN
ncbi:tail fiber assembly protein [Burkholderia arboris]|uniref:tail fiber assembly protein n=1 Tax=Burkholderia arboris TaxID=488730 RepID=UPI00210BF6F2|nr:tail fiber assembly protein [Burkholderia arboris]UTV56182.1 tail fiber assembly protein [Burkholderia arboris]